jgi:hypothetical protein
MPRHESVTLLNCLGMVVKKIAAERISSFCERHEALHEGQFGCRKRRSAINAVAKLIATIKKAWQQKKLVGALFMDVKGAFNYVARKQLLKKIIQLKILGDLI